MNKPEERARTRARWQPTTADKIFMIAIGVVMLLSIALNLLGRANLMLIFPEVMLYMPMMVVVLLLIWGAWAIFRRIQKRTTKIIVGGLLAMALMFVFTLLFTYASFVAAMGYPQKYAVIRSPSGAKQLVILRGLDPDESRAATRRDQRLADAPDGDPEITVDDVGYVYVAYPPTLGVFCRTDADASGDLSIGRKSAAALMVDWSDDETSARLYVENPETADGGEWIVRFEK